MLVFTAGGGEEKEAIKSAEKQGKKHDRSKSGSRARVEYSVKKSGKEYKHLTLYNLLKTIVFAINIDKLLHFFIVLNKMELNSQIQTITHAIVIHNYR